MLLDFLFREVHEKIEGFFSRNGKYRGLYGIGVYNIRVIPLCQ